MKTRIIVGVLCALVAISLLVLVGYGFGAYISIFEGLVCGLCMHEIMGVCGCKNKVLTAISIIFSAVLCPWISFDVESKIGVSNLFLYGIYILALMILMLKMYEKTKFEDVVMAAFCSAFIPLSVTCIARIIMKAEERPDLFCRSNIVFILLMGMYSAWLTDSIALFSGKAFGKHKLAPNISPKKTIEGAIGGVLGTTVFAIVTFFICDHFYFSTDTIKWWMVIAIVPFICIMGMCGDLAASVIKRNFGVKDFGTLLPEHGGAMDRIDSFLFAMPFEYIVFTVLLKIYG